MTRPFGWLAAVSVNWLDENPREFAGVPGLWWQDEDGAFVDPRGMTMTVRGQEFTTARRIKVGDDGLEVRVGAGNAEIGITNRGDYMIVTYDPNSPLRTNFHGVPCYDPNQAWLLQGRFEAFDEPESITLGSVAWHNHDYGSPGAVRFNYDGAEYALAALEAPGGGLNIVFKDATSGVTTYPACRSLTVETPDEHGTVLLDFNRAVNLPCAFTDNFPICPVPPPQNQLPFPIDAGKRIRTTCATDKSGQHLARRRLVRIQRHRRRENGLGEQPDRVLGTGIFRSRHDDDGLLRRPYEHQDVLGDGERADQRMT